MGLGALISEDWRSRPRRSNAQLGWVALSLTLHLGLVLFPGRFDADAFEPASSAPLVPLIDELPVELQPDAPKAAERAAEPAKDAGVARADRDDGARTEVQDTRPAEANDPPRKEPRKIVTAPDTNAGAGGANDASDDRAALDSEEASFASPIPSRPSDRLMFDPLRSIRGSTRGRVRVLIDSVRLRRHPLGESVARLLTWADSGALDQAAIDPIGESELLFVDAPELQTRSGLVLMIQHRLRSASLRARLTRLTESAPDEREGPSGELPLVRRLASGDRFLVVPAPGLLVLAPEAAVTSVASMAAVALPTPPPPAVIWAHIESPEHALRGTLGSAPEGLRWVDLRIALGARGGVTIRLEAEARDSHVTAYSARSLVTAISEALERLAGRPAEQSSEGARNVDVRSDGSILVLTFAMDEAQLGELVSGSSVSTAVP